MTVSGSLLYFAYGSNMHPERIEERLGACAAEGAALLSGWALTFDKLGTDGSGKCDIVRMDDETEAVHGALYALTPEQAAELDSFEGGYRREELTVEQAGATRTAYAYVAEPQHQQAGAVPYAWYRDLVVAGASYHGMPDHYREKIGAVAATVDSDRIRLEKNLALLRQMDTPEETGF